MSLEGIPPPYFFSELRILKDLRRRVFVTAHSKALSARNRGTAHSKGVTERLKVERFEGMQVEGEGVRTHTGGILYG